MRVLVLHSRYLSGPVSGENRVVDDEVRLLREAGHDVGVWQPSVDQRSSALGLAADAVWSTSAVREVRLRIRASRPSVVHVHSLYPRLSPAVLRAVPREAALVVTLHNFRLMCLPATYLRDGEICELCAGHTPWRGIAYACYRGSRPASAALAVSLVTHRAVDTLARVDRFLAVSRFVAQKHVEAGLDRQRIGVKPNFVWPVPRRADPGRYLLYLGRLAPEKGLDTVIRALPPGHDLVVAGDGPERERLERTSGPGVVFRGPVPPEEVDELLRGARALVVPSRWYEGQPRAILEAFAAGVPVLATKIGGLPELVEPGVNGELVGLDDEHGWRAAMARLADPDASLRLGKGAHESWRRRFTPEVAQRELEAAYSSALSARSSSRR